MGARFERIDKVLLGFGDRIEAGGDIAFEFPAQAHSGAASVDYWLTNGLAARVIHSNGVVSSIFVRHVEFVDPE